VLEWSHQWITRYPQKVILRLVIFGVTGEIPTYHKRHDTKDDDTESIIELRRQASYRLSADNAVQNKEAFQGENIQDGRYDGTEIS
jgi:hypothetical protein